MWTQSGASEYPSLTDHASVALPRTNDRGNHETGSPGLRQARDRELVLSVLSGKREDFYRLIEPYLGTVHYVVHSLIKNPADVEDVVQDALLSALSNLRQLRSHGFFRAWLTHIAVNEARMKLRFNKTKGCTESLSDLDSGDRFTKVERKLIDERNLPSKQVQNRELREVLRRALERLAPKYREVFVLRDIQQFNMFETATILGISVSLAKTRLHRARLNLRHQLSSLWNSPAGRRSGFNSRKHESNNGFKSKRK